MVITYAYFDTPTSNEKTSKCAVFEVSSDYRTDEGREDALKTLTAMTRRDGFTVDKSALAYEQHGRLHYYGSSELVDFLNDNGMPSWTSTLDV